MENRFSPSSFENESRKSQRVKADSEPTIHSTTNSLGFSKAQIISFHSFFSFLYVYLVDPEGKVVEDIWNEGTKHPHVKYYYSGPQECMFILLARISSSLLLLLLFSIFAVVYILNKELLKQNFSPLGCVLRKTLVFKSRNVLDS